MCSASAQPVSRIARVLSWKGVVPDVTPVPQSIARPRREGGCPSLPRSATSSSSYVPRAADAELLHLELQRRSVHSEAHSRTVRARHHPLRVRQSRDDVSTLLLLQALRPSSER